MSYKNITISIALALFITACGSSNDSKKSVNTNLIDQSKKNSEDRVTQHKKVSTPTLSLNGDKSMSIFLGDTFNDPKATATDEIDGNITSKIKITSDLNNSKAGAYTITYTVTNSSNKSASTSREVVVKDLKPLREDIPIDSNIELGHEDGILYYADPRPEEHGLNRVIRVDYNNMSFSSIKVNGNNPHSIDRAGDSDKFYVRTQNSYSFDVVNFKTGEVKTIDLNDHKPRAIGAHNKKYDIQLLSGKDMPIVDVIDCKTDRIIATLGDRNHYNKSQITSNAGAGSATGHALWFDDDHLGLIDRVNRIIKVYKVSKGENGLEFKQTSTVVTGTALHALERDRYPKNREDLRLFYAMGEGDISKGFAPYILELRFDPKSGKLERTGKIAWLSESMQKINNVSPTAHHGGVTPDGKYFVAPILDGKVYIIDRAKMKVVKIIQAKLGAAHVEFSKSRNLAIITNHFSNFLTIIDLSNFDNVKTIQIGFHHEFDPNHKHLFQPHFSYVSKDGKYYYTFATQDGDFLKIDLDTFEIVDKIHVGGAPEQAHS